MREISRNVPFFIYFKRYFGKHKQFCVSTKTWTLDEPKDIVSKPTPKQPLVKSSATSPSHPKDKTALEIVAQKLEELAKRPAVSLPKCTSQLKVLKLRTTPSNSSSDTDEESLEAKWRRLRLKRPERHARRVHQPISKAYKETKKNKPEKCHGCGERGHYKRDCSTRTSHLRIGDPKPQEPSITQPLNQGTSKPKPRVQQPKVEPIYNRFVQPKKEVKIDDLQRETKETRKEIGTLKQNLQALQETQSLENTSYQSNKESPSDNKVDQIVDPAADHIQEPINNLFLDAITRINFH